MLLCASLDGILHAMRMHQCQLASTNQTQKRLAGRMKSTSTRLTPYARRKPILFLCNRSAETSKAMGMSLCTGC